MPRNDRHPPAESPISVEFAEYSGPSSADEPFFLEVDENPADPSSSQPAADVAEPPTWFRRSEDREQTPAPAAPAPQPSPKAKPRKAPSRRSAPVVVPEAEDEQPTWKDTVVRWLRNGTGAGYGISIAVHVLLLLVLSLWVLHRPQQEELITTLQHSDMVDMASIQDVEIEKLEDDFEPQVNDPLFQPAPLSAPDIGIGTLASSLTETKPGGFELKIPEQAVTKGSFTVWTEPADPEPGQDYVIKIQIKLNRKMKRYPRRDLKGKVVGTDGYVDHFGGPTEPGYLPVEGDTVRYDALEVPSASKLIKDVITVESKILNEKQTIELVF